MFKRNSLMLHHNPHINGCCGSHNHEHGCARSADHEHTHE